MSKGILRFGGYRVKIDEPLAQVTGFKKGQRVAPSEITRALWKYIKRKKAWGKGRLVISPATIPMSVSRSTARHPVFVKLRASP